MRVQLLRMPYKKVKMRARVLEEERVETRMDMARSDGQAAGMSGDASGAAVAFHPERRPAVAAMVPNSPTQASLKSPVG